MLEAEIKLELPPERMQWLRTRLDSLGAFPRPDVRQQDIYFAHPSRHFAETDEALRLRLDEDGLRVTYKGPKLDPPRKTREEIEFPLGTELETAHTFLSRLGFTEVARVAKTRTELVVEGPPRAVVCIDRVDGLGTYCEIEVEASTVEEGRASLQQLTETLGVDDASPISTSYLELLLSARR